jgi:Effector-associated domain 1
VNLRTALRGIRPTLRRKVDRVFSNQAMAAKLSDALREAFTRETLAQMLYFRFNKRLDDISSGGNFQQVVFELITAASREGWTADLVHAAHDTVPGNQKLSEVASEFDANAQPKMEPD